MASSFFSSLKTKHRYFIVPSLTGVERLWILDSRSAKAKFDNGPTRCGGFAGPTTLVSHLPTPGTCRGDGPTPADLGHRCPVDPAESGRGRCTRRRADQ